MVVRLSELRANAVILLGVLLVGVLHVAGAFGPVDRWVLGNAAELFDRGSRSDAPILVALDARLVDRWGPPPWSEVRWRELSEALGGLGVAQADLLEPVALVLARSQAESLEDAATEAPRAVFRAPTLLVLGDGDELVPMGLAQARAPFVPWDAQVYLPPDADGVVRDLTAASGARRRYGRSAFCEWVGRCPDGGPLGQPIRSTALAELPTLSAAALLDGHARLAPEEARSRTVLVGLTAPGWARTVHATARVERTTAAHAVAAAVASARSGPPARTLQPLHQVIGLLMFGLVAAQLHHRVRGPHRTAYVLFAPLVVVVVAIVGFVFVLVVLPVGGALGAVWVAPVVASIQERARFTDYLDRIRRQVAGVHFQFSPRAQPLKDHQEVLIKLGALTRAYCKTERCAWFRIEGEQVVLHGAFRLPDGAFRQTGGRVSEAPWSTVLRRPRVGEIVADLLVDPSLSARLIPVFSEDRPVGIWCIPFVPMLGPPPAQVVAGLVDWLTPRLQLEGPAVPETDDAFEADLQDTLDLVAAVTEERRRQGETLRMWAWPTLVADVSGAVVSANQAFQKLLLETELGSVTTLRELLFRLRGEREVGALAARLFSSREPVMVAWHDPMGRAFHVWLRPVEIGADGALHGYVAMFLDVTAQERLKMLRTRVIEETGRRVVAHLDAIRDALEVVQDDRVPAQVRPRLDLLEQDMGQLRSVAGFEVELDQPVSASLGGLLQIAIDGVRDVAMQRQVRVQLDEGEARRPAMLVPTRAQRALSDLLVSVVRGAPHGAEVAVRLSEDEARTLVEVEWPGAGLDERAVELLSRTEASEAVHLPPHLAVFGRLKEVFGDLQVQRTGRFSTSVRFCAPRAE